MSTIYGTLFIYGLELLNTRSAFPSYGPLDAGRINYEPLKRFYCYRCKVNFDSQELLAQHLWDKHPTRSPVLILGERELSSTRHTVRSQGSLEQIFVLNAELIKVNDNTVSLKGLNKLISSATNQLFQIEIINEGIHKRFELDVKLVSDSDIQNIDQCFFDCFNNSQLTNEGIQTFIKLTSGYSAADEYVDGLVNYLVGLQAKVGRASVITFEEHIEKLNQAFSVLAEFKSPLAIAVCDIISFMMNALSEVSATGSLIQVNSTTQFLLTGQHSGLPNKNFSSIAQLPIDNATHSLIELINHELSEFEQISDVEKKVSALFKQYDFSSNDKSKINLLLFWKSCELGDRESQKKYKKRLIHWDEIEQVIAKYE